MAFADGARRLLGSSVSGHRSLPTTNQARLAAVRGVAATLVGRPRQHRGPVTCQPHRGRTRPRLRPRRTPNRLARSRAPPGGDLAVVRLRGRVEDDLAVVADATTLQHVEDGAKPVGRPRHRPRGGTGASSGCRRAADPECADSDCARSLLLPPATRPGLTAGAPCCGRHVGAQHASVFRACGLGAQATDAGRFHDHVCAMQTNATFAAARPMPCRRW